ncbi:MAG TPA: hypothetical protein PKM65_18125 [Spirochaetota bacterium]|nr:hypothetical protein [Spirochaetota bacterium]HNT13177.1 hypothetical protein [Spirochaetota bacterium]HNV47030.1 hypothetical protein [Spirochaetota bacterium]HOS39731.1 hypothetical protein [Spirochaetota bacterium]HPU90331.1 hypothetical protein [Spirochaetota bacterium]
MKKLLFLAIILALSAANAHAAFEFEKQSGITVVQKNEGEEETELLLKDARGNAFTVVFSDKISDNMGKLILTLKDDFYNFKTVKIKDVKFAVGRDSLDANLTPAQLEFTGQNLLPYITSGLLFTYRNDLRYNFRIAAPDKNNREKMVAVRIRGEFMTEDRLCAKIAEAVKDPVYFNKKRDPEYLIGKIEELEKTQERVRYAVMTLHNTGFFSGPAPVQFSVIKRVIELKAGNPKLSKQQLVEALEKENIKTSGKEVSVVLAVFFNEFE